MRALAGALALGMMGCGCYARSIEDWRAQIYQLPEVRDSSARDTEPRSGTVIVATGKLESGGAEREARLWLYTQQELASGQAIAIPKQAHGQLVVGAPHPHYVSEELHGVVLLEQDDRLYLHVSASEGSVDVDNEGRLELSGWLAAPVWNDDPVTAATAAHRAAGVPSFRPATLPYERGELAPQGYELEQSTRWGTLGLGIGMFVVPYAVGVSIAGAKDFEDETWLLAIPVAGPTLYARRPPAGQQAEQSGEGSWGDFAPAFLLLDTAMQAGGIALMIVAAFRPKRSWRRIDERALRLRPVVTESGRGAVVEGSF